MSKNIGIELFYNPADTALIIANNESAKYIRKISIDVEGDTIKIDVYKKTVFKPNSIINSASTKWKIMLKKNVTYVKFDNKITQISNLKKYFSKEVSLESYYPIIEIFPTRFPYIAE